MDKLNLGSMKKHNQTSGVYTETVNTEDEYEDEEGRTHTKDIKYAGAGVGHICDDVVALKGPNAGAGLEKTKDGIRAVAQAEVYSSSMSVGAVGLESGVLKTGAGIKFNEDGMAAKIDAKLAEVSASAGPAKVTLGLSADTGVGLGKDGVEAKFLGTGFKLGREIGISVGGSGFSLKLW